MKQIEIINIYRPPKGNDKEAMKSILEFIKAIKDLDKKDVLIMGDLNWDYFNTRGGKKMIDEIISELGLFLHTTMATRISGCKSSLLDLILSNMKNVAEAGCLDYALSDHFPVYLIKKRLVDRRVMKWIYRRSLKNYDFDYYDHVLCSFNWDSLFCEENDVDTIWSSFKQRLCDIVNGLCPFRWMRVRMDKPVWLNSYIQELATDRDRLFRNYRRGKKTNENLYKAAVLKRREYVRACTAAKNNYFKEQLVLNKKNQTKFWKTIEEFLGNQNKVIIGRVYKYGTDDLLNLTDSLNEINSFFAEIGDRVSDEIPFIAHSMLGEQVDDLSMDNFELMT